jgi:hypothetical protein
MKAYILRDREVTDETKKAEKSKASGPMDKGAAGTARERRAQMDQTQVYCRARRLRRRCAGSGLLRTLHLSVRAGRPSSATKLPAVTPCEAYVPDFSFIVTPPQTAKLTIPSKIAVEVVKRKVSISCILMPLLLSEFVDVGGHAIGIQIVRHSSGKAAATFSRASRPTCV